MLADGAPLAPMSLNEWTALALASCKHSSHKVEAMKEMLKPIITDAVISGDAATRDWSSTSIPLLPSTSVGGSETVLGSAPSPQPTLAVPPGPTALGPADFKFAFRATKRSVSVAKGQKRKHGLESEDMVACNTEDSAKHDECFNVAPQHSAQVGVLDQQEPRNPEPRADTRAEEAVDSGTSFAHVRDASKSHTNSFCGAASEEGEMDLKPTPTDRKEKLLVAAGVMGEAALQTARADRGPGTLGGFLGLRARLYRKRGRR